MRDTIEKIVASPVPVVTYVAPSGGRAASAGFFLLEAGDVAAMAPGTNTGAAHPVAHGRREMDPVMKQKVENDAAAYLRSICGKRGRNSDAGRNRRARKQVLHRAGGARPAPDRPDRAQRTAVAADARWPHGHALRRHARRRCTPPARRSWSTQRIAAAEDHLRHRRSEYRARSCW